MKAAGIIAAGLGERLAGLHPGLPKPLVPVGGKPLVHWVVSGLLDAGIERLVILFNSKGDAARDALKKDFPDAPIEFLRADTPTSFASFRLVAATLARKHDAFLMSTVDALIPPAEVRRFAYEALVPFPGMTEPAAAVALTHFVEDEKPLWADTDADGRVTAFGDAAIKQAAVTCGLYAMTKESARHLRESPEAPRLRDWWTGLSKSHPIRGVTLSDTVDVDRPEDLPAAERITRCFAA
ncbi:MAG: NDP-sugar synthase [Elusimicrobia bacterium]|nr:NDP-sugar synthase [Elusimicrobiota bacterium]